MELTRRAAWTGLLCLGSALPARAESIGGYSGLGVALASFAVYGLIAVVLLVMLIRAKWRRAGLWSLGVVATLAIGPPFLSQSWQAWKLSAMEGREIVGKPPSLASRTPLFIAHRSVCDEVYDDACAAAIVGRGEPGVYFLDSDALDGIDLTKPVALADLPLEFWNSEKEIEGDPQIQSRPLSPSERTEAAGRIDYVVIMWPGGWPYPIAEALDLALRSNPTLNGMRTGESMNIGLAPLDPALGVLSFADLRFDLLDLLLWDDALALPLAPENRQPARNDIAGAAVAAEALCPDEEDFPRRNCVGLVMDGK
ncbi:hypothetical protein [Tabrizicola sp.]|uniref:hypothetical protein n=1 Tax=Tabrizicola sp. TaxID=2005166 RepID=UPI003F3702FE